MKWASKGGMDASPPLHGGIPGESSEDDLSWLLATAHHFLSTIKTGTEAEFDDVDEEGGSRKRDEQSMSDAESSALVPTLSRRPAPAPVAILPGPLWKPSSEAPETVIFVAMNKRAPLLVTSFIGYHEAGVRRRRRQSVDAPSMFLRPIGAGTGRAQSYAHLLGGSESSSSSSSTGSTTATDHSHPVSSTSSTCPSSSSSTSTSDHFTSTEEESSDTDTTASDSSHDSEKPYDPFFLDDPELRTGKHKTVIALPGYLGSLVHFIRAEDLKKELNDQFRQIHPTLEPSLTLSKIRKLKIYLIKAAEQTGVELSTVAKAFTFFEKLVLKGLVGKANRKLVGATCLLLATKANDSKDVDMPALFQALSEHLDSSRAEVLSSEFPVLAALEFDLFPAQQEYLPHLDRILTSLDYSNIQEYLGERMYSLWKRDVNY